MESNALKNLASELRSVDFDDMLKLPFSVLDRKVTRARDADKAFDRQLREAEQRLTDDPDRRPDIETREGACEVFRLLSPAPIPNRFLRLGDDAEKRRELIESALSILEPFEQFSTFPKTTDFRIAVKALRQNDGWMREVVNNDLRVKNLSREVELKRRGQQIIASLQPMQDARWRLDEVDRVSVGWTLVPRRLAYHMSVAEETSHPDDLDFLEEQWGRELDFAIEVAALTLHLAECLESDWTGAETRGRSQGSGADPSPAEVQPPLTGDHDAAPRESAAWAGTSPAIGGEPQSATGPGDVDSISSSVLTARDQYLDACEALNNDSPTDREAYDLLAKTYTTNGEVSPLPKFETWSRYLRKWRGFAGEQKNNPRRREDRRGEARATRAPRT